MSETLETPVKTSFLTRVMQAADAKVQAAKNGETDETPNENTANKRKIVKVAVGVTALAATAFAAYKLLSTTEEESETKSDETSGTADTSTEE